FSDNQSGCRKTNRSPCPYCSKRYLHFIRAPLWQTITKCTDWRREEIKDRSHQYNRNNVAIWKKRGVVVRRAKIQTDKNPLAGFLFSIIVPQKGRGKNGGGRTKSNTHTNSGPLYTFIFQ